MSAIKKFFEDERARKVRIREIRKAKLKEIQETVYVVDQAKLDKAYSTLMNWTIYFPEDLLMYFEQLDQEEYEYVLGKKADFPKEVQYVLWGPPPVPRVGCASKLKVVPFTDTMYTDMKISEQKAFNKKVDDELKKQIIPSRPHDSLDGSLENLRKQLKTQEEHLETLMKAPTKKYVAPSMRKQMMLADPEVKEMQKKIEKTKNEISTYETYVSEADDDWAKLKRLEIREVIAQAMLAV